MKLQKITLIFTLIFLFWGDQLFSQSIIPATMNTSEGINEWVNIGPEGAEHFLDVAFSPTDPQVAYISSFPSFIYKSTDAGRSWFPITPDGIFESWKLPIAVDPKNPSIIYVASKNIHKSTDGGSSWIKLTSHFNLFSEDIVVDPVQSNIIYVAADSGVYKSVDSGQHWVKMNTSLTYTHITQLAISSANHRVLYASCYDAPVIFKSVNAGTTWTMVYQGQTKQTRAVAVDPTDANVVYISEEPDGGGIFKSTDGGVTWDKVYADIDANEIVVDPLIANIVYFVRNGGEIYKSFDKGKNWAKMSEGITSYGIFSSLAVSPVINSQLVVAADGLPFYSNDGGSHWHESTGDFHYQGVYDLLIHPKNPDTIYVATWGRGLLRSADNGISWQAINYGHYQGSVYALAMDPTYTNTLFCGGGCGDIYKSTDYGNNWFPSSNGIVPGEGVPYAIVIDPSNSNVIYAGIGNIEDPQIIIPENRKIFKSIDGGNSWSLMSNGITHVNILSLIMHPQNSSILYAGTFGGGIFKTTNGAVSWTAVNNGIDDLDILTLAMDPNNPSVIYAGTANDHVYQTSDGGDSWQAISSPDPNRRIQVLLVNPDNSDQVFCGTDNGFFFSQDAGDTWYRFDTGLTNQDIRAIALDPTDSRIVYAGSFGGSVFRTTISPEVLIGPSQLSFGEVPVDSSKTLYVSLVNSSPMLNLEVSNLRISGADSAEFSYNGPASFTMVPMETHGVEVVFSPQNTGEKNAILEIIHNGASSPDTVQLSGKGISATGIEGFASSEIPDRFALYPNYPNPFNPSTTIRFAVPEACRVKISLYDILGKRIRTLVRAQYRPGTHIVIWDGQDSNGLSLPSGEYLVRMQAGDFSAVKKVLLVK